MPDYPSLLLFSKTKRPIKIPFAGHNGRCCFKKIWHRHFSRRVSSSWQTLWLVEACSFIIINERLCRVTWLESCSTRFIVLSHSARKALLIVEKTWCPKYGNTKKLKELCFLLGFLALKTWINWPLKTGSEEKQQFLEGIKKLRKFQIN